VDYVVTEHGVAYLCCKSIQDRALALISIAHPEFRPSLFRRWSAYRHWQAGQKWVLRWPTRMRVIFFPHLLQGSAVRP
jgi:acyl-CoA hydrolase